MTRFLIHPPRRAALVAAICSIAIGVLASPRLAAAQRDPGLWTSRARLAIPRQEVGAARLKGRLYVAGGIGQNAVSLKSVERYDPTNDRWTGVADLPTTLHHFGMTEAGGKLYVVGGYVSQFSTHSPFVYAYDEGRNSWSTVAPLPRPRAALAAVTIGGKIYAVGGHIRQLGAVRDLTVYDPATNMWTALAPMPKAREHIAASAVGGKLMVAGGRAAGHFNDLFIYDPATNQWQTKTAMPTARSGNGGASLFGEFLVFGGEGPRMFPEAEGYDVGTDRWDTLTPMPTALHGIYPVVLGDEVIIAGGGPVVGFGASDLVLSFRFRRPTASVGITPPMVPRNGAVTFAAGIANPGRTRAVDIYLGYAGPTGPFAVYDTNFALRFGLPPTPTFRRAPIGEGLSFPRTPLVTQPITGLPPGRYTAFVAVTAPDAFTDARIDPGDVLVYTTAPFTVQ